MTDIFVSYAREDKDFVARLCRALRQGNREPWVDLEGILPSAEWRNEICFAIESAQAFLQIITPHSVRSQGCAEELSHALKYNKRIIPVLHDEVDDDKLAEVLKTKQWVFFRESDDFDSAISTIIKAVDTDIEWVRFHTRLIARATEWERHKRDYSYALRGTDLRKAESALTSAQQFDPKLVPLQIDFIIASRKTANRRVSFGIGAAAIGVIGIVVLGGLFIIKRQESVLNLAANFREMGLSELQSNDPLGAEIFFSRALSMSDNVSAREHLLEARSQSPRLVWISPPPADSANATLTVSMDGVLFAEVSSTNVSVWNVLERRQVRVYQIQEGQRASRVAAFGPSHRLLAVSTANKVEIWDLQSPSELPISTVATATDVSSLAISFDDTLIITGEGNGTIASWKIATPDVPERKFSGHSDRITGLTISSDDRFLVSVSWDETATVWDLLSGKNYNTFSGHDDALLCVAISPDGEIVASAGWDDTIWLWDRRTAKRVRALTGHRGSILSLAFSPDGKWLVSGSEDRTVRLWDVEKGRHILTFPGHAGDVSSVSFLAAQEAQKLTIGDVTGVVRLWDLSQIGQRSELTTLRGPNGGVTMISFDPVAPLIASSSSDQSINIWDLETGKVVQKYRSQSGSVSAVAFSPDGKRVASASKNASILIWDLDNGPTRILRDPDPSEQIRHIVFSPNGRLLAGGSENGKIRIWNLDTGNIDRSFAAHSAKIQGLQFNPGGTLLASASEDTTIKLWDVNDWTLKSTLFGHRSGVYEIAFSPDGKLLLSGSDDKTARLWNVASAKEIITPIQHNSPVWAVDFEPDGKLIATGSEDSTVQLWKLNFTGTAIKLQDHFTFRVSDGPIWWLRFHSNAENIDLGVASQDKTVRVFHMSRLGPLFSKLNNLELEAEEQGGLVIGEAPSGDPEVVPAKPKGFVAK